MLAQVCVNLLYTDACLGRRNIKAAASNEKQVRWLSTGVCKLVRSPVTGCHLVNGPWPLDRRSQAVPRLC